MIAKTVDIQQQLSQLYTKWKSYSANERTGYINFLTEFLACFGINFDNPNDLPFEKNTGRGFADLYIKDTVIIEMKDRNKVRTREDLLQQLPQALKYWEGTGRHVPFLVLSNFNDFVVYDTRDATSHHIKLADLENKIESFNFLLRLNPIFVPEQEEVTRKSAKLMGKFYQSLKSRQKGHIEDVDTFVLQCLFCLFSEDIGYLPAQTFTNCVRRIIDGEDNSANILSTLFKMMDERDHDRKKGRFENVRYFNGPLFRIKPEIVLNEEEIGYLWDSCQLDWKNVRPEIFGALFESSQTKSDRHKDGMHFTSEEDILKVIKPCILDPWNEIIDKCKTISDFQEVHKKLKSYRILDPACGSGNFLVVSYRELKALEAKIFMEYKRLSGESYAQAQESLGWFSVTNMYGIELNSFPSFLTRVSLWITKKLVRNHFKLNEPDLPLEELKHIIAADALEVKWDDVDVIIGNPPFIGYNQIRGIRGDDYFEWLSKRFKDHNKLSDYCTYWYEKVLEDVRPGVRVGLVSTKTISQTNSRKASLDKIIASNGTIFNAISNQTWSGEAKVHVSIVNFINKGPFTGERHLNGKSVPVISSRLLPFTATAEVGAIPSNQNYAFVGPMPKGKGFLLTETEKDALVKRNEKNKYALKRWLTGEDLNQNWNQEASRWIIDFQDWSYEVASKYEELIKIVRNSVKNQRSKVRNRKERENWWRFAREQMDLRARIAKLDRYICVSRVSKYPIFVFVNDKFTLPADSTVAITYSDYEHLGVLQSKFHVEWYYYQCSTLKSDLRYTSSTVFDTFPFPEKISKDVAEIMEKIDKYRNAACLRQKIGLTTLYNQVKEGGHDLLKKLHSQLDLAVAKSYKFPTDDISRSECIIDFLVSKNQQQSGTFEFKAKKVAGEIHDSNSSEVEAQNKKEPSTGNSVLVQPPQMPRKTAFEKTLEKRLALATIITSNLSNDKNFGRTKFAKVFYVCDEESDLDLKTEYTREAAGPLDQRALYNDKIGLESLGSKYELFSISFLKKGNEKVKYTPGAKAEAFLKPAGTLMGKKLRRVNEVIEIFKPLNTEQSEIVATLYACWKDLLLSKKPATPEDLVNEFRNKWHPRKKRFTSAQLFKAIEWMKKKHLVPTARGKMTKTKDEKLILEEEIPF